MIAAFIVSPFTKRDQAPSREYVPYYIIPKSARLGYRSLS